MSARDDLAAIIGSVVLTPGTWHDTADAILGAGWVPPERLADVVAERDKAREECGYEKRMRKVTRESESRFIQLKKERDEVIARVRALVELPDPNGAPAYQPYAVDLDDGVHMAVLVDDLRRALGGEAS